MNRRDFVALLTAASATMKAAPLLADPLAASPGSSASPEDDVSRVGPGAQTGFPIGDYTPFGYLDNPWHTWDLHPSGVFRSLPGI